MTDLELSHDIRDFVENNPGCRQCDIIKAMDGRAAYQTLWKHITDLVKIGRVKEYNGTYYTDYTHVFNDPRIELLCKYSSGARNAFEAMKLAPVEPPSGEELARIKKLEEEAKEHGETMYYRNPLVNFLEYISAFSHDRKGNPIVNFLEQLFIEDLITGNIECSKDMNNEAFTIEIHYDKLNGEFETNEEHDKVEVLHPSWDEEHPEWKELPPKEQYNRVKKWFEERGEPFGGMTFMKRNKNGTGWDVKQFMNPEEESKDE